jgi:hypothetical protein
MSRPGFEPGEASTLEKSHLDSLSAGYSEPLLSRHLLTTFGPLQYVIFNFFLVTFLFSFPYNESSATDKRQYLPKISSLVPTVPIS